MADQMQMGGYNPFNSPYDGRTGQNRYQQNQRMFPITRYGTRRKKRGKSGYSNPATRLMRTGGRGIASQNRFSRRYPQYAQRGFNPMPSAFQLYQQMYGMGGGGYLDPSQSTFGQNQWFGDSEDDEYDRYDDSEDFDDEFDDDDFDFDDSEDAAYIEEEADLYRQYRSSRSKREPRYPRSDRTDRFRGSKFSDYTEPTDPPIAPNTKKPVNKMEQIIGKLYTLSMYQVILLSNANPHSFEFYAQRWGITKDVASFINRLLFGGIYTMRMKEWLKRFDSDHLFYRESSQLFDNPVGLMNDLEAYLGVEPLGERMWKNITAKVYNVELEKGKGYQHKEQAADEIEHWDIDLEKELKIPHPTENRKWQSLEVIEMLRDYYRAHNNQLADLFGGKKYPNWDY